MAGNVHRFRGLCRRLVRLRDAIATLVLGAGLAVVGAAVPAQAAAAVPNHWGFAYVNVPTGIPDPSHQAGSWPAPFKVSVSAGAPGQEFVRFPRIASPGGVVHVTAVADIAVWCQAQGWFPSGPDEIAVVRCFRPGGAPVFVPFSVTFTQSSTGPFPAGRAYGYVHFSGGIVSQFNSSGAPITVTPAGTGTWVVHMAGLGSAGLSGNVQVTAVDPVNPAKCKVAAWKPSPPEQVFLVRCFDKLASPLSTGWSLSYQRGRAITGTQPKAFGYTFDNQPLLPGPYAPVPPAVNFNSLAGINTIRAAGTGLRLVIFPRAGVLPNTVLVTAFGPSADFCNMLTVWGTAGGQVLVRDVACYTATGVRQPQASLITYTSAF
ncbi:MAG: hypothetical protein JOY82_18250 [Streptosporangiaceae bacterium]|nr:hypothetical protein [Streptosporangiaceae bacterium]MBV9856429.1 hypothetical protein [Streptosporangiaceae bacterium]